MPFVRYLLLVFLVVTLQACNRESVRNPKTTQPPTHSGDEIVACGQLFHTGTPVVLWTDPGGYNAYAPPSPIVDNPRSPWQLAPQVTGGPAVVQYGLRSDTLTPAQLQRVREHGWDLPLLQSVVDQFVIHYDGSGLSKGCFDTLHERRGLSVHFMLDIDGTIYQTLDLQEKAWHATTSNNRSIGVEIANVGAFLVGQPSKIEEWYTRDADGRTRITIPARFGNGGVRTPGFIGRPIRNEPIVGYVQGKTLRQYDLTPEQYAALAKLTATLCRVFPRIRLDYPHDSSGQLVPRKLADKELAQYHGVLGHYHIQTNKEDPGPAFQWDKLMREARE